MEEKIDLEKIALPKIKHIVTEIKIWGGLCTNLDIVEKCELEDRSEEITQMQ